MSQIWITLISIVETLVLITLIGLSVWSVSIMIDRRRYFRSLNQSDIESVKGMIQNKNWDQLQKWSQSNSSIEAQMVQQALNSNIKERESLSLLIHGYLESKKINIEKGFAVLATLGANAPFIGLFGTVLGIIRAFAALGGTSADGTASVMSGISLALIATATGLVVAIPAVVAYNIFNKKLRDIWIQCESIKNYLLSYRC